MPDRPGQDTQLTSDERRRLRALEREAKREAAGRASESRRARQTPAPGGNGDAAGAAGPETARPGKTPRPWLRRLLWRAAAAGGLILILLVIYPPFLVPVDGSVTSRFFLRTVPESPFLFDVEHHRGIDFGAPAGTRVGAARSGRVIRVAEDAAYGNVVDVRHPLGMVTRYAHLSEVSVREGQWRWRGARVGSVGMTGRATGPHLHFEIRLGERSLPPGFFLLFHQLRRAVIGG
jgi:murein DD-endopeptidase MepM/ murein hydrolase activator NlpD